MIISPPFLPVSGATSSSDDVIDPMMDAVDLFELAHGVYPVAFDRRWHTGVHLMPATQNERVRAIADGEVVAYRVCQKAIDGGEGTLDSNPGFVLLKHTTDTGDGRSVTFFSLYMHLLELDGYTGLGVPLSSLPEFLRAPTPDEGQAGGGKKVYRKDVLGLTGSCHGMRHVHFEIFMLPTDFTTYFGPTQLDNKQPTTPDSKDYWGHSHYIIPAGQTFLARPSGVGADGTINGIQFPALQGQTNLGYALHVESYFHRGNKYTNSWQVNPDGTRTLLTPQPVKESGYEYGMYDRAKKLYSKCPSDGYELLRFGRILSDHPVLSNSAIHTPPGISPDIPGNPNQIDQANPSATWIRITYAQGKEGYIDVYDDGIVKLSDADFPFFVGWRKISEGSTPYSDDGMCDVEELNRIAAAAVPPVFDPKEYKDEDALCNYILGNDSVRIELRGFICEAPTEWDKSHNDTRYARLNDPDGFYGKQKQTNPDGYSDFLKLLGKFQFWDKTGLPDGKLWFFHPLQFIRYFRRCGWLSRNEMMQLLPANITEKGTPWKLVNVSLPAAAPVLSTSDTVAAQRRVELNRAIQKYGITPPVRMAGFFGNVLPETQWYQKFHEGSPFWYKPWDGRGYLQLSLFDNYNKYWEFKGITTDPQVAARIQAHTALAKNNRSLDSHGHKTMYDPTNSLSDSETQAPADVINRRDDTVKPFEAADSSGAYWAWSHASGVADKYYAAPSLTRKPFNTIHGERCYYENISFGGVAGTINTGSPSSSYSAIWGVENRFVSFSNAQVVLLDVVQFPQADGSTDSIPEHFIRREIA